MGLRPKPRLFIWLRRARQAKAFLGSFACPKEMNQRKGQPQIFFGINILSAAHAIQLVVQLDFARWAPQTVLLTYGQRFAANKMSFYFQKRFGGIARLTAIWFYKWSIEKIDQYS